VENLDLEVAIIHRDGDALALISGNTTTLHFIFSDDKETAA
jgi:hypothetical protein